MSTSKQIIFGVLTTLFVSLSFSIVKASNLWTYELEYQCTGGNNYDITAYLYRDCRAATPPASITANFTSDNCSQSTTANLSNLSGGEFVSLLCEGDSLNSACHGGTEIGVERYTYTGSVTLPAQCPDWVLSWSHAYRHDSTSNLKNPDQNRLYIDHTFDNTGSICNQSPTFTSNPPIVKTCQGQQFCYNVGAVDADPNKDSLVYRLIQPKDTFDVTVPYDSSYSASHPVTTTSGNFYFNTSTGHMCFTPNTNQNAVIAVAVDEYRNGSKIATTKREVMVLVENCSSNQIPVIDTPGITNLNNGLKIDSNTVQVCPGDALSFDLNGKDPDGQPLTMTSNIDTALSSASFNTAGTGSNVTGTFSWTPTSGDLGTHTFVVYLEDSNCSVKATNHFTIDIQVIDGTTIRGNSERYYCTEGDPIQLNAAGGSSFSWSPSSGLSCTNCPDPKATPSSTTTYTVTSNYTCNTVDSVTVYKVPGFTISSSGDTALCDGTTDSATIWVNPNQSGDYTYAWNPTNGLAEPDSAQTKAYPSQTINYIGTVTSDTGCTVRDTVMVGVAQTPMSVVATATPNTACWKDSVQLSGNYYLEFYDDFDPDINSTLWDTIQGGSANMDCGSESGNALKFDESVSSREAVTKPLNVADGGVISFYLRIVTSTGSCGSGNCDEVDGSGETVALEYSTDGGSSWSQIKQYTWNSYDSWTLITDSVPPPAKTTNTMFRWRQLSHSSDCDHWAIDKVSIGDPASNATVSVQWSPSSDVSNDTILNPITIVTQALKNTIKFTVSNDGCDLTDSVMIKRDTSRLQTIQDTTLCRNDSVRLNTTIKGDYIIPYFVDSFESGSVDTNYWKSISHVSVHDYCGAYSDSFALWFGDNSGQDRVAVTKSLNVAYGGFIEFYLKNGTGSYGSNCDPPSSYEEIRLEYSIDNGNSWNYINDYDGGSYGIFTKVTETIPPAAQTTATQFRLMQFDYDYDTYDGDKWMVDNFKIAAQSNPFIADYHWTPTTGLTDSATRLPMAYPYDSTKYIVATTVNICKPKDTVNINLVGPKVSPDSIIETACNKDNGGAIIQVDYGTKPFNYQWSDTTQNGTTASGLPVGTYTVTVTDAQTCWDTTRIRIDSIPQPKVITKNITDAQCYNEPSGAVNLAMQDGSPPFNYSWNTGDTTQDLNNVKGDYYIVTVTDNRGCTKEKVVHIGEPGKIWIATGVIGTDPGQSNGKAWATATGGTYPFTYQWNDPNNSTTDTITNLPAGNYTVTVTDANDCVATTTISVPEGKTGIGEASVVKQIDLFPNPVKRDLNIDVQLSEQEQVTLEIKNPIGETIFKAAPQRTAHFHKKVRLNQTASGLYFVKIKVGAKQYIRKIMVAK